MAHPPLCSVRSLLYYRVETAFNTDHLAGEWGEVDCLSFDCRTWDARSIEVRRQKGLFAVKYILPYSSISETQIESRRIFVSIKQNESPFYLDLGGPRSRQGVQSFRQLRHYRLYANGANEKSVGRLTDLICEKENLKVRYLVISIGSWTFGPSVLIPTNWIHETHINDQTLSVALTQDVIKNAPRYDPLHGVTPLLEEKILEYYQPHLKTRLSAA